MNKYSQKSVLFDLSFLTILWLAGLTLRLVPRLLSDPYLLTFNADIWYRLCLAQSLIDNGHLPAADIRYMAYGHVPVWYPPLGLYFFAFLTKITSLDLPVVISRIVPFYESLCIVPIYFLCRDVYNRNVAVTAAAVLTLTPSFTYWTGIATPQSATVFAIPLLLLMWVRYTGGRYLLGKPWAHLIVMGCVLAVNFLTHLTYFNAVIILLFCHLALMKEGKGSWKQGMVLLVPVVLSQALTVWWWGPPDLYFWWTKALTTSSGLQVTGTGYLLAYGMASGVLGYAAFFGVYYLTIGNKNGSRNYYLLPVFWALFPMVESHIEHILVMTGRQDLAVNTLVAPLEGFRFFVFLAQPLAVCLALCLDTVNNRLRDKRMYVVIVLAVFALLFWDLQYRFKLDEQFREAKFTELDIEAARWYRQHSTETDRILSDYYSAQLFSGFAGGRALLGSMFPLRNTNLPYINGGWTVLYDIYDVYRSTDIGRVRAVLRKYGCTMVYYSDDVLRNIEFLVNGYGDRRGLAEGKYDGLLSIDHSQTLLNPDNFEVAYKIDGRKILRMVRP